MSSDPKANAKVIAEQIAAALILGDGSPVMNEEDVAKLAAREWHRNSAAAAMIQETLTKTKRIEWMCDVALTGSSGWKNFPRSVTNILKAIDKDAKHIRKTLEEARQSEWKDSDEQ